MIPEIDYQCYVPSKSDLKKDMIENNSCDRRPDDEMYVLVADDEESLRSVFFEIVEMSGCRPVVVNNGREAVKQAREKRFELIILDLKMPELTGLESLKKIREFSPDVPVLITSGFDVYKDITDCMSLGALHCITKPFIVPELIRTIKSILSGRKTV